MWHEHPVKVAEDNSAIVSQNEYGVLIDLTLCGDAMWNNLREPETRNDRHYYYDQKYRYIVWSNLEKYLVGVVEEREEGLWLTTTSYGFQHEVTLENVIQFAAQKHNEWIFASLDPTPKLKDPHDPKFVADVKRRLKNVHKINNATDVF